MAGGGGVRQFHQGHGACDTHGLLYWRQIHGMDDGSKPITAPKSGGAVAALTVDDGCQKNPLRCQTYWICSSSRRRSSASAACPASSALQRAAPTLHSHLDGCLALGVARRRFLFLKDRKSGRLQHAWLG